MHFLELLGQDAAQAVGGAAARLLDQHGDREGFIEQPQPALLIARAVVAGIKEHPAARKDAMRLGDRAGQPMHVEILAVRAALAFDAIVDEAADLVGPVAVIGGVDRIFARRRSDADIARHQHELAALVVEREMRDAVAQT